MPVTVPAGQDLGQDGMAARLGDFLLEVADDDVPAAGDGPGIGVLLAGDDLEQGRLPVPLAPTMATRRPALTWSETSENRCWAPWLLDTPDNETGSWRAVHWRRLSRAARRRSNGPRTCRIGAGWPSSSPDAFQAFSTEWAVSGESQMARTEGPAPEQAPAAPISYAVSIKREAPGSSRRR